MATSGGRRKVKVEEGLGGPNDASPSPSAPAAAAGARVESPRINEEDLQLLTPKIADKTKYPPGCPVWHDLDFLVAPSSRRLVARPGVVTSVYIDIETHGRVYRVKAATKDDGGRPSTGESSSSERLFRQDRLAYAMNCPVKVRGMVEGEPDAELDGVVVCPKPGKKGDMSYSVNFPFGEHRVITELGVGTDRITYRHVRKAPEASAQMSCTVREASALSKISAQVEGPSGLKRCNYGKEENTQSNVDVASKTTKDGGNKSDADKLTNCNKTHIVLDKKPLGPAKSTSDLKLRADTGPPTGKDAEPASLPMVTPKAGLQTDSLGNPPGPTPRAYKSHTASIQKPDVKGVYSRLTVPSWVADSIGMNLRRKSHAIEKETRCSLEISDRGIDKKAPMYVTLRPMHEQTQFDLMKASQMVEDTLLECLDCNSSKVRLRYESGLSREGATILEPPSNGIIQQQCSSSKKLTWMKLLDVHTIKKDHLSSFSEELQRMHRAKNWPVEVLNHFLIGRHSAQSCKPFVLICGKSSEHVDKAANVVADIIGEFCQRSNTQTAASEQTSSATLQKRKSLPEEDRSLEKQKRARVTNCELQTTGGEATCILTVPLWVMQHSGQAELFHHLLGRGGHKTKEISSQTRCRIHLTDLGKSPIMQISIQSTSDTPSFLDVRKAKAKMEESLLEFLGDNNSEGRLLYELANAADGTYRFRRVQGAIQRDRYVGHRPIWMNLVELPSAEYNGELTPHGNFLLNLHVQRMLIGSTTCSVEVYCQGVHMPTLCDPYVLVCGGTPVEVNEVVGRVTEEIRHHMQKCRQGCRYP